jgi:hypothetical protein
MRRARHFGVTNENTTNPVEGSTVLSSVDPIRVVFDGDRALSIENNAAMIVRGRGETAKKVTGMIDWVPGVWLEGIISRSRHKIHTGTVSTCR